MVMPAMAKQLYRCRSCGRQSRENPAPHAYPEARREEMLHAYQERSSLRGLPCTLAVLATCGIRPPDKAFENTQSRLLLLADSEEEE